MVSYYKAAYFPYQISLVNHSRLFLQQDRGVFGVSASILLKIIIVMVRANAERFSSSYPYYAHFILLFPIYLP